MSFKILWRYETRLRRCRKNPSSFKSLGHKLWSGWADNNCPKLIIILKAFSSCISINKKKGFDGEEGHFFFFISKDQGREEKK